MNISDSAASRFWSKVSRGEPDECWLWNGWKSGNGYGRIQIDGKALVASRVALELSGVSIPDGMFCCHRCDNPPCCNPAHLFVGSVAENNMDRSNKGRNSQRRGALNRHAKLTPEIVEHIRASSETNVALAARYGVRHTTVSDIRRGRIWKSVRQNAPNTTLEAQDD